MKEFIIKQNESGQRVDKYLMRILPGASKSFLYKMIRKKNIVLNDLKITGNEIIKANDSVKIWFSDDTFNKFANSDSTPAETSEYLNAYMAIKDVSVLYEDDNIIILDKPAGVLSQKSKESDISLNEWLIGYLLTTKASLIDLKYYKPSVQNRLDRNTSGIVLCALSLKGAGILSKLIKEHKITKIYQAIVEGELKGEETLIGYHRKNNEKNTVEIISPKAYENLDINLQKQYSKVITCYKALEGIKSSAKPKNASFIEVKLITGKSHQIRAHMASIGHPLVGDSKYGRKNHEAEHYMLHACRVTFPSLDELGKLSEKTIYSSKSIF